MYIIHTFRYLWSTQCERISSGTRETAAHRNVIDHVAFRIGSARANTRIHAKLIDTRLYSRAVRIHSAFWTTVRVWITEIVWKARADTLSAICVWSTGGWIAQIFWLWLFCKIINNTNVNSTV